MEAPVTEQGTPDSIAFINFANHTSGGAQGLWLRPYVNTTQFNPDIPTVDGTVSQNIAGVPGANYALSAWTAWEGGYCGGIDGSGTQSILKMEFLNGSNAVIGSPLTLDLFAAGMTADLDGGNIEPEDWQQFTLNGTAPAGTATVRVTVGALGMFNSGASGPQSAFFDDFSLIQTIAGVPGDYNANGVVDGGDYVVFRDHVGTTFQLQNEVAGTTPGTVTQEDYTAWRARFGNTSGSGAGLGLAAVPEPGCVALLALALGIIGAGRVGRRLVPA